VDYDPELIVPDKSLSIDKGAIDPWNKPQYTGFLDALKRYGRAAVRFNVPWFELTAEERNFVLQARPSTAACAPSSSGWKPRSTSSTCASSSAVTAAYAECPACHGARLRPEAL